MLHYSKTKDLGNKLVIRNRCNYLTYMVSNVDISHLQRLHRLRYDGHKQRWWHTAKFGCRLGRTGGGAAKHTGGGFSATRV